MSDSKKSKSGGDTPPITSLNGVMPINSSSETLLNCVMPINSMPMSKSKSKETKSKKDSKK